MTGQARVWMGVSIAVVAAFLATTATYYHPGSGFTAFIGFPADSHHTEIPAVQSAPHVDDETSGGYDGQFYAQFAVDPLLRDPAIDGAMDLAPYRARRILLSWAAWAAGLGQPARVLRAYAVSNVVCWLALAWLLTRWIDPRTSRGAALWAGALLSHGALSSVRYALTDLPGALLVAAAIAVLERGRPLAAAVVLGAAGLARETMTLAAAMFGTRLRRSPASWLLVATCLLVTALPLLLWIDYLRSIYRSLAFAGGDHITLPLTGFWWKLRMTASGWAAPGYATVASTLALASLVAQAGIVLRGLGRGAGPWAWAAAPFVALALVSHPVIWTGAPGAFTRVLLPLAIGANVLLARGTRAPWWLIVLANLGVIPGVLLFAFGWA